MGVELKLNLKGKSQTDRLIGQVNGFLKDYHEGIIVVLCGTTDRDSEEYLRDSVRDFSQGDLLLGNRKDVVVVVKNSRRRSDSGNSNNNIFGMDLGF